MISSWCLQVVVTLVALSQDGSLMGTVDVKLAEEGIGSLVCLKFWVSRTQNKEFTLSTIVYEPHRCGPCLITEELNEKYLKCSVGRYSMFFNLCLYLAAMINVICCCIGMQAFLQLLFILIVVQLLALLMVGTSRWSWWLEF